MNLDLPSDSIEFAEVVRRALDGDTDDTATLLDDLGVLDLAGPDSADPANAQLNVVVALETTARAGCCAPIAETIWARSRGVSGVGGFVAMASDRRAGDDRLVPYGASAESLIGGSAQDPSAVDWPASTRPAQLEIEDGHLWVGADVDAPSLAQLDPGYAWRAASASTVGAMTRATEMAIGHARDRVQFGKPLASFQALQFRLAECHWRLLGLRLLTREAAWRADRADRRADAVSALAWLYARDVGRIVTRHAQQVHGAIGFTRELGLTTVTGSAAVLRALLPATDAARAVRASRAAIGRPPPSTILGGFAV